MLLLAFLFAFQVSAYRFIVDSRSQECVYADLNVERVVAEIGVVSGSNKDIGFKVANPSGTYIYSLVYEEGKHNNYFNINTKEQGTYSFCFDNSMSLYSAKMVDFKLNLEESAPATKEEVSSIETKLEQVKSYLADARSDQKRFRNREARNRKTGDATNLRTTALFFIGCFIIAAMGLFQVWYIKRQFKRGR
ncbi:GOLD domain-containing protein [Entamoeba marina]